MSKLYDEVCRKIAKTRKAREYNYRGVITKTKKLKGGKR